MQWKGLKYVSVGEKHIDIINEEMKGSCSEEEGIGIRKCRRRSRVDIIN